MATPAIKTEQLSKRYATLDALTDLDLEVGQGEVSASSGPTAPGRQQPSACSSA